MKKTHSHFSKIFLLAFIVTGMIFAGCSSSNGSPSDGAGGSGGPESQNGYKVTIHWQLPGAEETIEETWTENNNSYDFSEHTKEREGYKLQGFKLQKPDAENFSDNTNYIDYSIYITQTITKDIDVYAIWKNDNIVLKFNEKKYNSDETEYESTIVYADGSIDPFTLPDINKTSEDDVCTGWAKEDGTYADEANTTTTLSSLSIWIYDIPKQYDEKEMAICQIYNFYESWYNINTAKKYIFNKNDCSESLKLSSCETKTIYMNPASNKKVDPSNLFTREGYTFLGFNKDPIAEYASAYFSYDSQTTYYAIWKKAGTYINTYVKDYGVSSPSWVRVETTDKRISDGKDENGSPYFTKPGKTLGGWNFPHKAENAVYADYLPGQRITTEADPEGELDVWYAKWIDTTEFNSKTLEITFYSDNTKTESFTLTAYHYPKNYRIGTLDSPNCCLVLPECTFEKEGYTFECWTNGTGTYPYTAGSVAEFDNKPLTNNPLTADNFTAKWTKN